MDGKTRHTSSDSTLFGRHEVTVHAEARSPVRSVGHDCYDDRAASVEAKQQTVQSAGSGTMCACTAGDRSGCVSSDHVWCRLLGGAFNVGLERVDP